jgi:hypothetical protein
MAYVGRTTGEPNMDELRLVLIKQWKELSFWALFNIVLGTTFVWLAWVPRIYYRDPKFDFFDNIKNGNLLVFTVTLCASSLGFYSQLTKEYLLYTRRLVTWLFITLIIITSYIYAHSSAYRGTPNYDPTDFLLLSGALFVAGCFLSFFSYLLKLKFDSGFDLRAEQAQEVSELSKEASSHDQAGGIKLS